MDCGGCDMGIKTESGELVMWAGTFWVNRRPALVSEVVDYFVRTGKLNVADAVGVRRVTFNDIYHSYGSVDLEYTDSTRKGHSFVTQTEQVDDGDVDAFLRYIANYQAGVAANG